MTPTNLEILQIMIDGGERMCDESLSKWHDPGYYADLDQEIITERLLWWSKARRKVREFATEIRAWQGAVS